MSWLSEAGHGVARMLTLPRATRERLQANPVVQVLEHEFLPDAIKGVASLIDTFPGVAEFDVATKGEAKALVTEALTAAFKTIGIPAS